MPINQISSLRMDNKFKKTPIGEIPMEWDIAHIVDVCEINPSKQEAGHLSGDDSVSFLPMEHVSENGKGIVLMQERPIKEVKKGYVYFKEDDILFAKISPCMENGKIAIASKLKNGIGFGSTEFHVLRPNRKKLSVDFAFQWVVRDAFRQLAVQHFRGSAGQQRVQRDFFAQANIPIPPLDEQKKIAEILSSVDDAIEKADAVIDKTRDLKKALMQRLLTRGIGHTKFKKTPIGEIPVEWEAAKLGLLCLERPEYGANASAIQYQEGLPRYVRITDVMEKGLLAQDDKKSIPRELATPYLLQDGDFLFARSGATVGKTYLYRKSDGECAFAGYMIRFRPDRKKLLPEFLFQLTHSDLYYQWVISMLRAGAQPNINGSEYSDFLLP
ncbi:MAG: restriction endonuclease subunit S, partial [Elusimicrobia bacterium]|nr:restriction endonuclease subunit S [Elusimicrobiota bacterium]